MSLRITDDTAYEKLLDRLMEAAGMKAQPDGECHRLYTNSEQIRALETLVKIGFGKKAEGRFALPESFGLHTDPAGRDVPREHSEHASEITAYDPVHGGEPDTVMNWVENLATDAANEVRRMAYARGAHVSARRLRAALIPLLLAEF